MGEKDFIGKRADDATKIFGLIEKDTKSYVILFLSIVCGVFIYLYISAKNENIKLLTEHFVKQAVQETLPKEVKKQIQPIEDGWDEARNKIDTLINRNTK